MVTLALYPTPPLNKYHNHPTCPFHVFLKHGTETPGYQSTSTVLVCFAETLDCWPRYWLLVNHNPWTSLTTNLTSNSIALTLLYITHTSTHFFIPSPLPLLDKEYHGGRSNWVPISNKKTSSIGNVFKHSVQEIISVSSINRITPSAGKVHSLFLPILS